MKRRPSKSLAWAFFLFQSAFIFFLSAQQKPKNFPGFLDGFELDKVVHFCIYMLLGYLTLRALIFTFSWNSRKLLILLTLLFGTFYGLSDEFHQYFVPTRSVSAADWFADVLGTAVGVWLCYFLLKVRKARNAPGQRF